MVKHLEKDQDLNTIIKDGLYLVDFYADWCGPCKMLAPILEKLTINVLKVNVDEFPDLAKKYGIMSIPTMIFFKDGSEKQKLIGLHSQAEIEQIVNNL